MLNCDSGTNLTTKALCLSLLCTVVLQILFPGNINNNYFYVFIHRVENSFPYVRAQTVSEMPRKYDGWWRGAKLRNVVLAEQRDERKFRHYE